MNLKFMTTLAISATFLGGAAHAASSACAARIDGIAGQAEPVAGQRRTLLDHDLRQARKEAGEGDEQECAEILDHADKLLKQSD